MFDFKIGNIMIGYNLLVIIFRKIFLLELEEFMFIIDSGLF